MFDVNLNSRATVPLSLSIFRWSNRKGRFSLGSICIYPNIKASKQAKKNTFDLMQLKRELTLLEMAKWIEVRIKYL